jgi:hypothetical protein
MADAPPPAAVPPPPWRGCPGVLGGSALLFNACPSSCSRPRALRPVRRTACACSPNRRRQCQARRRRPRFAVFVDLRPEPAPPGAPGRRVGHPPLLPVAREAPERRRPLRTEPATLVARRRPLRTEPATLVARRRPV